MQIHNIHTWLFTGEPFPTLIALDEWTLSLCLSSFLSTLKEFPQRLQSNYIFSCILYLWYSKSLLVWNFSSHSSQKNAPTFWISIDWYIFLFVSKHFPHSGQSKGRSTCLFVWLCSKLELCLTNITLKQLCPKPMFMGLNMIFIVERNLYCQQSEQLKKFQTQTFS